MKKLILGIICLSLCTSVFGMECLNGSESRKEIADKINEIIDYINKKECNPKKCEYYYDRAEYFAVCSQLAEYKDVAETYAKLSKMCYTLAIQCKSKCVNTEK